MSIQCKMGPFTTVAPREKSHLPFCVSNGSLTPFMQHIKIPNITISIGEEPQGSCHNSRRAPFFPPHLDMRVHFPASSGKESWCSHHTSRGSGLNLTLERNCRVESPFQKTQMTQSTPDTPDSPVLNRRASRGLTQNTMAGVTALWHLERKPPIPSDNLTGSLTLLFQLVRRADLHGSTRDEA